MDTRGKGTGGQGQRGRHITEVGGSHKVQEQQASRCEGCGVGQRDGRAAHRVSTRRNGGLGPRLEVPVGGCECVRCTRGLCLDLELDVAVMCANKDSGKVDTWSGRWIEISSGMGETIQLFQKTPEVREAGDSGQCSNQRRAVAQRYLVLQSTHAKKTQAETKAAEQDFCFDDGDIMRRNEARRDQRPGEGWQQTQEERWRAMRMAERERERVHRETGSDKVPSAPKNVPTGRRHQTGHQAT
ncbi:hypothetical protein BKA62DRAFT_351939 [Auriculariales sp. MPI-PUGE-AT-0066]|nr:hypothetical protein BKA62DRAFT_351939 [Auriculariales sp. MPI-PUGE-AT-0066]